MEQIAPDIHEQILVRLDVKALIRCKSVCKSWKSLISSTRFVKTHLNYSHNNDCTNNTIGSRRIVMDRTSTPYMHSYKVGSGGRKCSCYLVGSYNGLVCISKSLGRKVLVANPLTREMKTLKNPELPRINTSSKLCWGFGYDSSTDDYKVIVGHLKSSRRICFQMLTLKSNVWIDIGKVNCKSIISSIGTLCTGKLHWFVRVLNGNGVKIISFDLSKEKFKEIPEPDNFINDFGEYRLGVIKERLCIYDYGNWSPSYIWVMNNDDVKQPWKLKAYDHGIENHVVHFLKRLDYLPNKSSFCTNIDDVFSSTSEIYIPSPIFVPSLVSPHVNRGPKRKRQA